MIIEGRYFTQICSNPAGVWGYAFRLDCLSTGGYQPTNVQLDISNVLDNGTFCSSFAPQPHYSTQSLHQKRRRKQIEMHLIPHFSNSTLGQQQMRCLRIQRQVRRFDPSGR